MFELLQIICVAVEDVLVENPKQEKPDNVKSLNDLVFQIKEILLSFYKNEKLFEEFRVQALHSYCLFVFCDNIRNISTVSAYKFLGETMPLQPKSSMSTVHSLANCS
jgi:hypothetical protein